MGKIMAEKMWRSDTHNDDKDNSFGSVIKKPVGNQNEPAADFQKKKQIHFNLHFCHSRDFVLDLKRKTIEVI